MDIYLIRHSKTQAETGLCYGQTDIGLAENFAEEALRIQAKLPMLSPKARVFSSPLTRCVQLAQFLSNDVIYDNRLLELNFGDWENQRFDALDNEAVRYWSENFVDVAPPNGESFTDLHQRVGAFWQDLTIEITLEPVMIVTHAGTIRALLAYLLQLPLARAFQFRIGLGTVHKLHYTPAYTYIDNLNIA
jgi:alpha-ribazole phosphatase